MSYLEEIEKLDDFEDYKIFEEFYKINSFKDIANLSMETVNQIAEIAIRYDTVPHMRNLTRNINNTNNYRMSSHYVWYFTYENVANIKIWLRQ